MSDLTIWHNPRCSKSRQTLALLQSHGLQPQIRLYLIDPPSQSELKTLLQQLNQPVTALLRKGEKQCTTLNLSIDSDPGILLAAMAQHPILIERPVVMSNGKAAIGRPPEAVLSIL